MVSRLHPLLFFLFFLTCPHKRENDIQTNDLRFIKRDPSRLSYLLGMHPLLLFKHNKTTWLIDYSLLSVFSIRIF
jgi:hypothetical protein